MTDEQLMQDAYDALCVAFAGRQGVAEWEQNETLRAALRERLAKPIASGQGPTVSKSDWDLILESAIPGKTGYSADALKYAYESGKRAQLASGQNQEPAAWQTFDGEGGYELRQFSENENYRDDYIKRNGEKYSAWVVPLYTHPAPTGISQADCLWARNRNAIDAAMLDNKAVQK